ncbi:hypothetical protein BsWGS_19485 [Bradybaena similaris]
MGRMRLSAVNFLVAAILVVAIKETSSYPTGAPQYTCRSQIPLHVNCTQDGPAPYGIAVNEDGAKVQLVTTDHKKYSVTLASLDDSAFRGFICAVSDAGDDKYLPIGKMSLLPSSANEVQLLSCTKSTADTGVTHTSNSDKHKVQFDWSPPSNVSPGQQYKLRCTMVMEFAKCWTNMQAIIIPLPASTSKNTTGVVDKSDDNTGDRSNAASTTESMSSTRSGNRALKPPNTRVRTPTKKIKFGRTHNSSKTRMP